MKTLANKQIDSYLLSANPAPMSFLSFQVVYHYKEEKKFIRSFNILSGGKTLKKIYLKEMILSDEKINIEAFITGELLKAIDSSLNNSVNSKEKSKTNYDARIKAANNLFSDLGL